MFIDNYQPDHDAEMEAAYADMDAYYHKPYSVKCGFCGLEQTAPEATLREIGWTLDRNGEYCFQAKCIRDRQICYCGGKRSSHIDNYDENGFWEGHLCGCSRGCVCGLFEPRKAMEATNAN